MKPENPSEPFKRAVGTAVRALAGEPELEVNFSAEPPALKGKKARLPMPSRNLPPNEIAIVRGAGDAYALKLAYHEDKIHQQFRPHSTDGAAIFEAAEQARVEAIGSLAMKGVSDNLAANLESRCNARGLAKVKDRSDAPLAEAVGLMVRERLTGEAPPESGQRVVDLWRPWIEERAGQDLTKLESAMRDQKAFAKLTRTILRDLQMGDEAAEDSQAEGDDEQQGEPEGQEGSEGAEANPESEVSEAELSDSESEEGEEMTAEVEMETADPTDAQESDEGMRPHRPERPFSDQDEWGYRIHTTKFDETVHATELCDSDELTR